MSDHLNNEFFQRLSAKVPEFKQQYADSQVKKMAKNGSKESLCLICGTTFDSWNGFAQKKKHCDKCVKLLKEGYTALISVDNRFAFVRFPNAGTDDEKKLAKAVAGKVVTVTAAQMDKAQKAQGKKAMEKPPEKLENN